MEEQQSPPADESAPVTPAPVEASVDPSPAADTEPAAVVDAPVAEAAPVEEPAGPPYHFARFGCADCDAETRLGVPTHPATGSPQLGSLTVICPRSGHSMVFLGWLAGEGPSDVQDAAVKAREVAAGVGLEQHAPAEPAPPAEETPVSA